MPTVSPTRSKSATTRLVPFACLHPREFAKDLQALKGVCIGGLYCNVGRVRVRGDETHVMAYSPIGDRDLTDRAKFGRLRFN
jgi:hypothetical protein